VPALPGKPADLAVRAEVLVMTVMGFTSIGMCCADHPQDVGPDRNDRIGCDRPLRSGFRGAQVRPDGPIAVMRRPAKGPGRCDPASTARRAVQCRGSAVAAVARRLRATMRSRWMMYRPDATSTAIPARVIAGPGPLAGRRTSAFGHMSQFWIERRLA